MKQYAIHPLRAPINSVITLPGSKSFSNRALIMASLADGTSIINNISTGEDTAVLIAALRQLGVLIEQKAQTATIIGNGGRFVTRDCTINVGAAGTTMRFLTALCALVPGQIILDGSARMRERPLGPLVSALRQLGADIEYQGEDGCPPLVIHGGAIGGGQVTVPGSISSQFITALLLAAPLFSQGLILKIEGEPVSASYIAMTVASLKAFGITVEQPDEMTYQIPAGQSYQATNYTVEGDASGASYFWAIAALSGGQIRVENIDPNSAQGDVHFADILGDMGCIVTKDAARRSITVQGADPLQAVKVNMTNLPDTAQTLAVVAAFARGKTRITGVGTLRIKETDRLLALQQELAKMDIKAEIGPDYIEIMGGEPHGTLIDTYKDHRMAMAFAVAGARIPGVIIKQPDVVAKSFPGFWDELRELGVIIS